MNNYLVSLFLIAASSALAAITVTETDASIVIANGDAHILTYHKAVVPPPEGADPLYRRSGFIHPLTAPNGALLTQIHADDHVHHLGLWHAWVKTKHKGREIDFWNLKKGQGTVRYRKTEELRSSGFTVVQEHVILPNEVILEESFSIDVKIDKAGHVHVDHTTVQKNISDAALELPAYRYGGPFAWRGPAQWNNDNSTILTSTGKTRADGHATRADWVRFAGPTKQGDVAVTILCHGDNFNAPQRQRIWPKSAHNGAIFYNWVPIQETAWAIKPQQVSIMQYRMVLSTGTPNEKTIAGWHKAFVR